MLTYLKSGDALQNNDVIVAGTDKASVLVVGTSAKLKPGKVLNQLEVDALKPRRWTPDREYHFGWAHWTNTGGEPQARTQSK